MTRLDVLKKKKIVCGKLVYFIFCFPLGLIKSGFFAKTALVAARLPPPGFCILVSQALENSISKVFKILRGSGCLKAPESQDGSDFKVSH